VNLNQSFALAAGLSGLDKAGLDRFCAIIGINGPSSSFDSVHQSRIYSVLSAEIDRKLRENRLLLHTSRGSDDTSPLKITISADGTYQKRGDRSRGYTSKLGIILIFDADTKLVIYYHIKAKYCHRCTQMRPQFSSDEEFAAWKEENHYSDCSLNFSGPSTEMERHSMKIMFARSIENGNLIYKWLVSDGDTKAFLDVVHSYPLCIQCQGNMEVMKDKSSDSYKQWAETDEYKQWVENHEDIEHDCNIVVKIDCVNHLTKNIAQKIEKLAKSGVKCSDGKTINLGLNRLGKAARANLQKNIRNNIRQHVRPNARNSAEIEEGIQLLKTGMLAALYHISDLPPKTRHQYCPTNTWCSYCTASPESFKHKPYHIAKAVFEKLLPILESYTTKSVLQRMLPGYNNNICKASTAAYGL